MALSVCMSVSLTTVLYHGPARSPPLQALTYFTGGVPRSGGRGTSHAREYYY